MPVKRLGKKLRGTVTGWTDVAVVGAGVVGCAVGLELGRRGVSVAILEAEAEPALQASGTNSGILHTGFDSVPGELETTLILRASKLRPQVLDGLAVPVVRCGAEMSPAQEGDAAAIAALADNARANGVEATLSSDGTLEVPGESISDPVVYTLALAAAAERHGAELKTGFRVAALRRDCGRIVVSAEDGGEVAVRVVVNCAGLGAGDVARLAGDDSFDVYPRKGEFLVFDSPPGAPLERILLPVPTKRTKGVLVFPTLDGKVVAGPTAVDQDDRDDWSVRPEAREEILPKAALMYEPLSGAEPLFSYAGLRPAGRDVNYVIAASTSYPGLINVGAIRSTGVTASLGIAEHVSELVARQGLPLGPPAALDPAPTPSLGDQPWWRRTAAHLVG